MSKRVTVRGVHLLLIAPADNTAPFKMSQQWQAISNTVFNLTSLRFEPSTSRSRDERSTAQSIQYFYSNTKLLTTRQLTRKPKYKRKNMFKAKSICKV